MRWCPGCGDYAVLKAVQRTMPDLGVAREKTVFVSGIGCSSRFPYYMATYGFHTIHGRAPAFATGVKLANPELDVWIITGDGDALSIGGNHTMHVLRRNLDCQILLFNNEIYGLTKGQYSPTSRDRHALAFDPVRLGRPAGDALAPSRLARARGSSPAAIDVHKSLPDVLKAAHAHKGASFVEIFQNCIVYNDDVFALLHRRATSPPSSQLWLKAGREDAVRGRHQGHRARRRAAGPEGGRSATIPRCWSTTRRTARVAAMLIEMPAVGFPVALGVIYEDPAPTFESAVIEQNRTAAAGKNAGPPGAGRQGPELDGRKGTARRIGA